MGKRNKQVGRIGNAIVNSIIEPIMKMQEENPEISSFELTNKLKERREHNRTKRDLLAQSVDRGAYHLRDFYMTCCYQLHECIC